jgi:hypothetical protein
MWLHLQKRMQKSPHLFGQRKRELTDGHSGLRQLLSQRWYAALINTHFASNKALASHLGEPHAVIEAQQRHFHE